jgi:ABC-2 type transport system permease protein
VSAAALRAVIARGVRDQRYAPLTWGGSLGALGALMAVMWPSIEDSVGSLLDDYPERLKAAFNIRSITSVETYIDAEMLSLIVPLAIAFLAVRSMTRAISTAEERSYLDTLLTAPLARRVLVAGSFIVTGIVVAAVLAVVTLMTWLAGTLVGADPSLEIIGRGLANVWPLAMLFAGVATLAAGALHRAATVTAIAAGTLALMYVIDLIGKLTDAMAPLRRVSAFRYYGSAIQDGIDPLAFAGLALVGLALAAAGALLFERRDIL